jgi:hypothetical protein
MNAQNATPELFAALAAAQAEVENAAKSSVNPHFKSRYADLAEVLSVTRPVYSKHGVSLVQAGNLANGLVTVTSILAHKSGGYITAEASCVPARTDAQGVGAAMTYLRRYSAAALLCIAQEDDDGETAVGRRTPMPAAKPAPVPAPVPAPPKKGWEPSAALLAEVAKCGDDLMKWDNLRIRSAKSMARLSPEHREQAEAWIVTQQTVALSSENLPDWLA